MLRQLRRFRSFVPTSPVLVLIPSCSLQPTTIPPLSLRNNRVPQRTINDSDVVDRLRHDSEAGGMRVCDLSQAFVLESVLPDIGARELEKIPLERLQALEHSHTFGRIWEQEGTWARRELVGKDHEDYINEDEVFQEKPTS